MRYCWEGFPDIVLAILNSAPTLDGLDHMDVMLIPKKITKSILVILILKLVQCDV